MNRPLSPQGPEIEKIQDRPPGLKFSSEIENFKRAVLKTPGEFRRSILLSRRLAAREFIAVQWALMARHPMGSPFYNGFVRIVRPFAPLKNGPPYLFHGSRMGGPTQATHQLNPSKPHLLRERQRGVENSGGWKTYRKFGVKPLPKNGFGTPAYDTFSHPPFLRLSVISLKRKRHRPDQPQF